MAWVSARLAMHSDYEPDFESFIIFTCPTCKAEEKNTIPVPAAEWDAEADAARLVERESEYICGNCLHTHPLIVRNLNQRITVKLVAAPLVDVKASKAFWSEEADATGTRPWEAPEDKAFNIFHTTHGDAMEVLESPHAEFFEDILSRMTFIQLFAALEAFLTDTLLSRALKSDEILSRLLAGVKDLQAIKVPLSDILADPDIVRHRVSGTIHEMSFHNLVKTDVIYNVAFGFSIFPDEKYKHSLLQFIPIRHDCVHRNGKTEDGKAREEVDYSFVRRVAGAFDIMVRHIESELNGVDYLTDEERTKPPKFAES
ncbi:hypothetical protein JQK15_22710 [Sphingobium sp. BHU LFT2]|uniref:hypothetical protein n=1 Tax=Sphingobium sp. BHU LFT2 TaxID=2807634 RepID=UPI001BE860D4|nr:hypothetical protein [Sphingobium sp. BHU LFT2]MBT2246322.1 hypothetical protein [Sphingobium sp. BHU LFT2]